MGSDLYGSSAKVIRALFASRIRILEFAQAGNAYAKASEDLSFEEYQQTKTELETILAKLKGQRSAALAVQKRITAAEKRLAEKAAVLSTFFPCEESKHILEDLVKDKALLLTLLPREK